MPYRYVCRLCQTPIKREHALGCAILDSLLQASESLAGPNFDYEKNRSTAPFYRRIASQLFWNAYQFVATKIF